MPQTTESTQNSSVLDTNQQNSNEPQKQTISPPNNNVCSDHQNIVSSPPNPLSPQMQPFQSFLQPQPSPHQVHAQMSPQVQSPYNILPNQTSPQVQQQIPSPHIPHSPCESRQHLGPSPMHPPPSPLHHQPLPSPQAPMNQVQPQQQASYVSPRSTPEGPSKVLEELLQGSPAPHRIAEPDMPILETSSRKIRESLDSHEDELLEDLANFDQELSKEVDESVVDLANDLIGKIEEQEFSEDEDFGDVKPPLELELSNEKTIKDPGTPLNDDDFNKSTTGKNMHLTNY